MECNLGAIDKLIGELVDEREDVEYSLYLIQQVLKFDENDTEPIVRRQHKKDLARVQGEMDKLTAQLTELVAMRGKANYEIRAFLSLPLDAPDSEVWRALKLPDDTPEEIIINRIELLRATNSPVEGEND
jgi:hypothetical protein